MQQELEAKLPWGVGGHSACMPLHGPSITRLRYIAACSIMILPALLVDIVPKVVVSVIATLVSSAVVRVTVVVVATLVTSELLASVVVVSSVTGAIEYTVVTVSCLQDIYSHKINAYLGFQSCGM